MVLRSSLWTHRDIILDVDVDVEFEFLPGTPPECIVPMSND